MTLTIELTGEMEQRLQEQAAASGCDVPSFVQRLLTENLGDEALPPSKPRPSKEVFRQRLQQWIALHPPTTHFVDDSRESIYAGRGE